MVKNSSKVFIEVMQCDQLMQREKHKKKGQLMRSVTAFWRILKTLNVH